MKEILTYGFDFSESNKNGHPVNVRVKRIGKGVERMFSMESDNSGFPEETFNNPEFDVRYFFKDMSAQDIEDLLQGRAYLEFWLPVINHEKPSGNNTIYTIEDTVNGMEGYFKNTMETGGVPGELDHPKVTLYSDNEKSIMNFQNNMDKIQKIDQDRVVWYVIGYKLVKNISYFKFRTSISNRRVVQNMLNGKAPSASIRVTGKFTLDPSTGIRRGSNVSFRTIDYVENPGFKMATLFQGAVDLIQSGTEKLKKVIFTNNKNFTNSYAFESINDDKMAKDLEGYSVYKGNDACLIISEGEMKKPTKKRASLESMLDNLEYL